MSLPRIDRVFRICGGMEIPHSTLYSPNGSTVMRLPRGKDGGYLIPHTSNVGVYTTKDKQIEYLLCFSPYRCGVQKLETDLYLVGERSGTVSVKKNGIFCLRESRWSNCLNDSEISRLFYHHIIEASPFDGRNSPEAMVRFLMTRCGQQRRDDLRSLIEGDWSAPVGNGSTITFSEVIKTYVTTRDPIKGQCFTFSALLCAMLRQIGIQARQVVGTSAGHPSQSGMIETALFGDATGRGFWNFHCWNECFIGGRWNFIDSTPQCRSTDSPYSGYYVCGPFPIEANSGKGYDGQLVSSCIGKRIASVAVQKTTGLVLICDVKRNTSTGRVVMVNEGSEWVDKSKVYDTMVSRIDPRYPHRLSPNFQLEGNRIVSLLKDDNFVLYAVDIKAATISPMKDGQTLSRNFDGYIVGGLKVPNTKYLEKWYSLRVSLG